MNNRFLLLLPAIVSFTVYVKAQSAFENSYYAGQGNGIVSNDSQFFIFGYQPVYLDENYQYHYPESPSFHNSYFAFNPLNMKGYLADGKVRLYSEDNLSYQPCGDVVFQTFGISVYDPVSDAWRFSYWDCQYWNGDHDSICQGLNDEFGSNFFEIAPINATDVFVLFEKSFLRINDTVSGNQIFRPTQDAPGLFPTGQEAQNFRINKGVVLDSALLLFTNKAIFKYDLQGNLLGHTDSAHASFNHNINQVFKLNDSLAVYEQGSALFSIDKDLSTTFLLNYSVYLDSLILVKAIGGDLWGMGTNSSGLTRFVKLDSALTFITYDLSLEDVFPVEFRVEGNLLVLIGNEGVTPFGNDFSLAVKSYDLDQIQDSFSNDASIIDYDLDVFYARSTFPTVFVAPFKTIKANLSFTVSNKGADTLRSVVVTANFRESISQDCVNYSLFQRKLDSLSIPPQDSQSFTFDSVTITTSTKNNLEFCVWTAVPNDKIDKDHSNDAVCRQHVIVSAESPEVQAGIRISPNPVSDILSIEGDAFAGRQVELRLYSLQGKELMHLYPNTSGNSVSISLAHIPQGVYLLQITADEKISNHKIVRN